jgi:hypothetical protein
VLGIAWDAHDSHKHGKLTHHLPRAMTKGQRPAVPLVEWDEGLWDEMPWDGGPKCAWSAMTGPSAPWMRFCAKRQPPGNENWHATGFEVSRAGNRNCTCDLYLRLWERVY